VPLAMIPGVFVPLFAGAILERWRDMRNIQWKNLWRIASTIGVLAFACWMGAEAWPSPSLPYFVGRIDPAAAVPWLTIHDMTSYRDVVFSPDLETIPFGAEAAIAGKLVYRATSFADLDVQGTPYFSNVEGIDSKVSHVCGPFQVVIVRRGQDADAHFDGRTPNYVIRIGGLTLMRFIDYPGAAKGCP
jgi:hypothetical protein